MRNKEIILFFLISFVFVQSHAQIVWPDSLAQFKYGLNGFYQYLSSEVKMPDSAKKYVSEAKVYVQFTVDTSGQVSEVFSLKKVGFGCDEEAIRVIEKTSGLWIPSTSNGVKKKSTMVIPVTFKNRSFVFDQEFQRDMNKISSTPGTFDKLFGKQYYEAGVQEYNRGNIEKALEYFTQATINDPTDQDAWFNKASIHEQRGEMDEACYSWKRGRGVGDMEASRLYKEKCKLRK